jgi:phage pi2 protein 07
MKTEEVMNINEISQETMEKFLLEELSEQESEQVMWRTVSNGDFLERLSAKEDEMIKTYLLGNLSAQEEVRFEKIYLYNPRRHERLDFIQKDMRAYESGMERELASEQPARDVEMVLIPVKPKRKIQLKRFN